MTRRAVEANLALWKKRLARRTVVLNQTPVGNRKRRGRQYRVDVASEQVMTLGTWLKNHPVPPAMRVLALAEAVSQLGVMEHGGNNEGREVQRYIHEGGGSGPLAWCGYFVAHCYRKAGSKSVTSQWAGVRFLGYIVGMKRIKLVDARPGDIIVYEFTGGGDGDHTGLLEHGPVGGMIVAIEGNTGATGAVSDSTTGGDGVYRKRRSVGLVKYAVRVTR